MGAGAVDHGALVQFLWDGLHKVVKDKGRHRDSEPPVLNAEADLASGQMDHIHGLQQRDHDGLEGDQHGSCDQQVSETCIAVPPPVHHISRHGGKQYDPRNADDRDDHVVHEQLIVLDLVHNIGIVFPFHLCRKGYGILNDLPEWLQGIHVHQKYRIDIDDGHQQEQKYKDPFPYCLFSFHYNATSLLLKIFRTIWVRTSTTRK